MAHIIDGKKIAAAVRAEIAERARKLTERTGIVPGLAVIIVGEDPASKVYVRNKKKACEEAGFRSLVIELPEDTSEEELLGRIAEVRADPDIHGAKPQAVDDFTGKKAFSGLSSDA